MIKDREGVAPVVALSQPLRSQAEMDLLGFFGARGDVGLRPRRGLQDGIGGAFPPGKMAGDNTGPPLGVLGNNRGEYRGFRTAKAPGRGPGGYNGQESRRLRRLRQ